ncbi:MAG: hypothetical protein LBT70_00010 [Holosporaceae bacterium]|nr:hypothetical protein [Holosporaceae bacterium]
MRWVYFFIVFVFSFCQSIHGHRSTLVTIQGANIPPVVRALVGAHYDSSNVDLAVCYATGNQQHRGHAAQQVFNALSAVPPQGIPPFPPLPRCHSEVMLLRAIAVTAGVNLAALDGCRIEIGNSIFFPCKTVCNHYTYPGSHTVEYNPGIPCDTLLRSCHTPGAAFQTSFGFLCDSILVTYHGGAIGY